MSNVTFPLAFAPSVPSMVANVPLDMLLSAIFKVRLLSFMISPLNCTSLLLWINLPLVLYGPFREGALMLAETL